MRRAAARRRVHRAAAARRRRGARVGRGPRVGESARHDASAVEADPALRALRHAHALRLGARRTSRIWRARGSGARDRRPLVLSLVSGLRWHDGVADHGARCRVHPARGEGSGHGLPARLRAGVARHGGGARRLDARARASRTPQAELPPYLAELPLVPAHRLVGVPRSALRTAPFNDAPVGNGPFAFASRRRGARWSFVRNDAFPRRARRAARAARAHDRRRGRGDDEVRRPRQRGARHGGHLAADGAARASRSHARGADVSGAVQQRAVLQHHATAVRRRARPSRRRALDRSRAHRRGGARGIRHAVVGTRPAGQSARVAPRRPRSTRSSPTRCSTPRVGVAARMAFAGAAADRSTSSCSPSAPATTSPSSSCRAIWRRAASRCASARRRWAPSSPRRAPTARTFDVLIAGIPGDLSLSYVSALFDSRQRGGTLDYTGFHRPALDDAAPRRRRRARGCRAPRGVERRAGRARHARAGDVDLSRARRAGRVASRARRAHGSARRARDGARLVARAAARSR